LFPLRRQEPRAVQALGRHRPLRPLRRLQAGVAAANLAGKAIVLKVNTEENPALAGRYHVTSIPNFALFRKGKLCRQQPGLLGHRQLEPLALGDA